MMVTMFPGMDEALGWVGHAPFCQYCCSLLVRMYNSGWPCRGVEYERKLCETMFGGRHNPALSMVPVGSAVMFHDTQLHVMMMCTAAAATTQACAQRS